MDARGGEKEGVGCEWEWEWGGGRRAKLKCVGEGLDSLGSKRPRSPSAAMTCF